VKAKNRREMDINELTSKVIGAGDVSRPASPPREPEIAEWDQNENVAQVFAQEVQISGHVVHGERRDIWI
jgi:hypothetical protein